MLIARRSSVKSKLHIMTKNMIKLILKNWLSCIKRFGVAGHRRCALLLPPLGLFLVVMWPTIWWSLPISNETQEPPCIEQSPEYEMNRNLKHYLQNIPVLIEPTKTSCGSLKELLVLVLVASTSSRIDLRAAVRQTWGNIQPTYFVMGLNNEDRTKQTVTNRLEAAEFQDLLVFDFLDHHLNQTLKTALMLKWTMEQCPEAQFMFKIEEEVMVNPWTLNKLLEQHKLLSSKLIGYSFNASHSLKSDHKKRCIQKLLREDNSLKYLSGTGYLIKTGYIPVILEKAYRVPMINLEDVYLTYLVAHKELGLPLTHDRRLSPYKPWLQMECVYWNQASMHRLGPKEMLNAWYFLKDLVITNPNVEDICESFNKWFYAYSEMVLY